MALLVGNQAQLSCTLLNFYTDVSNLHLQFSKIIVAKGNNLGDTIEALKGKRVVAENGSTPIAIVKEAGTSGEIIPIRSNEDVLKYVIDGRADCLVISKMAGAFFIANGYGNKVKFA